MSIKARNGWAYVAGVFIVITFLGAGCGGDELVPPRRGPGDEFWGDPDADCILGQTRCYNSVVEEVCEVDLETAQHRFVRYECKPQFTCGLDADGEHCRLDESLDYCFEGDVRCSPDLNEVMYCARVPPHNGTRWQTAGSCHDRNMRCRMPEPFVQYGDLVFYCVNECGGRGIELNAAMCSEVDLLPCAVWTCSAGTLVPDHSGCTAGGLECTSNNQCASCVCTAGTCIGDYYAHCYGADKCPPFQ